MTSRRLLRPLVAAIAAFALLAGACGDDDTSADTTTTSEPGSTTSIDATTSTEPDDGSTTTTEPTDTSVPSSSTSLPGEPFDLAPEAGRTLAVIGVAHDDTLNVRRLPGTDQPVVAELDPLADDFVASGQARMLTRSIWWEVTTDDGVVGWVGSRFTAQVGPTSDLTAQAVAAHGSIPVAETMADLGVLTAEALRTDPEIPSDIVMTVPPTVGDLGEVTYDLVGLGDDAVAALRLHVFGQPTESGEGFSLKSVEATDMCHATRGPSTPGGTCA